MKLSADQSEFVEQVGRFWESAAGSRSAGRILGWLMICEPDHQSPAQLVEVLGISSGSVSTQVRQLAQLGVVERVTFPGDRSSYFRLPDHTWTRVVEAELGRIVEMRKLADAGTDVLPTLRPDRVTELKHVTEFFVREWPGFVDRMQRELRTTT